MALACHPHTEQFGDETAGLGKRRLLLHPLQCGSGEFAAVGDMARTLAPHQPAANFRAEPVESMSFSAGSVDAVLSIAVLHFARDDQHFDAMLQRMWRTLRPGGLLFCRLASSIGIEDRVTPVEGRWHLLPDGSERSLVDEAMLLDRTQQLGAELLDPIKTTIVQGRRSMTTLSHSSTQE